MDRRENWVFRNDDEKAEGKGGENFFTPSRRSRPYRMVDMHRVNIIATTN